MRAEYENVLDDHLGKIHFTYVNTWDELLPAHWHEHLEIIYVLGGEITASINDVSYELKKGDIFLCITSIRKKAASCKKKQEVISKKKSCNFPKSHI